MLGRPGCGKGTFLKLIPEADVMSMSSDLLGMKEHPEYGAIITDAISSGCMVPTEIVLPLFDKKWREMVHDGRQDVVLDGVIRSNIQAEHCLRVIHNSVYAYRVIGVFIDVPSEECKKRMLYGRKRPDDTEESIARRFQYYDAFTLPVLEFLEAMGCPVVRINGNQSVEAVAAEAKQKLGLFEAK
jgi:adenylate kinase family enzyme